MLENFRTSIILFVAIRIGFSLCTYVSSGAECSIRPLPWDIRLKVAVGMAAGLLLLFRGVGNSQRSNPKKFLNADTFCLWSPMWSSFDCGFNWINPKSSTYVAARIWAHHAISN